MTRKLRQRKNASIHEAAHAVVAIALGRRFHAIELYTDAAGFTLRRR